MNWSNWEVVTGGSESQGISNIVDGVDSSLISIGVRSSDSSQSISRFLLGRVDVLVSIGNISKFILSLVLGACWSSDWGSNWSSSIGGNSRSSSISSNWSSNSWGSSISGNWSSSIRSNSWSSNSWGSNTIRCSIQGCDGSTIGKLGINSSIGGSQTWGQELSL